MSLTEGPRPTRVGIVGLGTIGSRLVDRLRAAEGPRLGLAFVGGSGTEMAASAWSSVRAAAGRPSISGLV